MMWWLDGCGGWMVVVVGWLWWLDGCGGWMVVEVEVVGWFWLVDWLKETSRNHRTKFT